MKNTSPIRAINLLCALFGICGVVRATDYTWTGNVSGDWSVGANWSSSPATPTSSIDTNLVFGPAGSGGTTLTDNLANPFLLNSIIFNNNAPAYTIGGNPLDFRANTAAAAPQIILSSSAGLTLNNPVLVTSSLILTNFGTGGLVLAGPISGPGGVSLGFGTALLAGSNTFAGQISVVNGTLLFGGIGSGATSIPNGGNVVVGFGGALVPFFGSNNTAATAKGTITLNANGTFVVPPLGDFFINRLNSNASPGTPTLDASRDGAVLHFVNFGANVNVVGDANWIGGANSSIVNDTAATMDINVSNGTLTSSVRLANGANGQGFQFNGNGTIALTNLGNTANLAVANDATVSVTDMAYLGTGSLSVADSAPGTIQYAGDSASSAKPIALGIRGGTIYVSKPGTNLTLTGVISGSSSSQPLILRGGEAATVTLSGNNTYTGPTIVAFNSTLSISNIPNGSVPGPLGASSSTPMNLQLGSSASDSAGTLQYTGATATTDRGVTLVRGDDGGTTIEVTNPATNLTFTGQILGTSKLAKTGPGTLTLANPGNNWSGGMSVFGGRLAIGANGAVLPKGGDVDVFAGVLDLGSFNNSPDEALGTIFLNSSATLTSSGGRYYLNKLTSQSGGALDFMGSVSTLVFANPGSSITINGNSTWSGPRSEINNSSLSSMDVNIAPGATLANSIVLDVPFFQGSFRITGGGTLYQTGQISAAVTVDHATLRIDNPQVLSIKGITLQSGTLQFSGASSTVPLLVFVLASDSFFDVTNPNTTLTLNSILTGPGPLIKTGPGTLTLPANNNSFSSGITIDNGAIEISADDRLGSGSLIINPRGILRYMSTTSTSRTFNLNGGTIELPTARTLTFDGASISGGFLRGVGFFRAGGGTSIAGTTALAGTQIDQFGPASLVNFTNSGFLTSSAPLTWNGGFNTGAGHLTVSSSLTTSAFENNGVINIQSGGSWTHTDNFLTSTGGSRITVNPGGTLTLLGNQLDLNGALLINNGTINGTTSVNFGSLAKGSGVYGAVNVTDGGRFSPGNSPGSVTTGSTTWNSGGDYLVEIADALIASGRDFWSVEGELNLMSSAAHPFTISLASTDGLIFDPTHDYTWPILHATDGISGLDASSIVLDTSAFKNNLDTSHFTLESTSNDLIIHFSAVPEPTTIGFFAFAALLPSYRRRFR